MKKSAVFLLLILLIILTGLSFSYQKDITTNNPIKLLDGSLEYDFMKRGNEKASKELYEFVIDKLKNDELKELNMTQNQIADFTNITPERVNAFYMDLNDDNVDEIIGYVESSFYCGTAGCLLFILQKYKVANKNIAFLVSFVPRDKFLVNKSKYNGYRTMKFRGGPAYKLKILDAGFYDTDYHLYDWKILHQKVIHDIRIN